MTNVVQFDELNDEGEIVAYQLGLPRIVLEGKDDVRLFKIYWFPHLIDSFEFVEAVDIADGGGCSAVRDAVLRSRQDNIPAFGFADRDQLFRSKQWALLFAVDDAAFHTGTRDEACYTTLRWEIEAYLLEPDLLPAWIRSGCRVPGTDARCAAALGDIVEECEHLIRGSAFFATAHDQGKKVNIGHFADKAVNDLVAACESELGGLQHDGRIVKALRELIQAVFSAAPLDQSARLGWLLRYVDTKRLLHRLSRRFHADREIRWFLAELMLQKGRRPPELERRLDDLRETFVA